MREPDGGMKVPSTNATGAGVRGTEQAAHTTSNALLVTSSSGTAFDKVLKKIVLSPWFS